MNFPTRYSPPSTFIHLLLSFCVLLLLTGCGNSEVEKLKKTYDVAKKLTSRGDLPDTKLVEYGEVSTNILQRVASIKIEASKREIYVLEKLFESYSNLKMWPEALQSVNKLIRLQPTTSEWYIEKGRILSHWSQVDDGKIDLSESAFKTALEIDPNSLRAHYGIGVLYAFRKGEIRNARRHFNKVIEVSPMRAKHIGKVQEARFALAKMEYENGNLRAAETTYKNLLEMNSISDESKYQTYLNLGKIYQDRGSRDMAVQMYREAQDLYPNDSKVREILNDL